MMKSNKPILSLKNITKRFTGVTALKAVSLDLYEDEILAIMGENGAGKSTLMKILSGLYPSSEMEGTIELHGQEVKFNTPHDAEQCGIAMIYQELNLELDLSVAENICLGILPKKSYGLIDWKKVRLMAKEALDRLHVRIDLNQTVRNLNPSMQQLVSIARALVRNPSILILDEPTSMLTAHETDKLMEIIRDLKNQGISCIYISHKIDEVFKLCDRLVVLRDGYYISEFLQSENYDSARIIHDMIGRDLSVMYPPSSNIIGEEILRIENWRLAHPFAAGKNIIEDVSFSLKKGEILGLTGLVGSGRSEILNSIFGLLPASRGSLYLEGKKITIRSPKDAKKYGIGLLTEDRKNNGIISCLSICHNMTITIINSLTKGLFIDRKRESKQASVYFQKLRIKAPSLKTLIANLSGGNQQKVILAKWLLTDLKILFLDEPTRGIDVGTKAEIYRIINDLAAEGVSIVMISSELPELLAICDRFVVLGHGVVQAELSKDEADEVAILRASSGI